MIGLGVALLLACWLALANRTIVVFSLDPINPPAEELSVQAPIYAVIFIAMLVGILLGGFTVWSTRR